MLEDPLRRRPAALGEHKPGRIEPGRIKRATSSLEHQTYHIFVVDTAPFICL